MARRKLSDIRQENKSAHELLHEIVELYEIAKRIQNQTKNILILH